MSRAKEVILLVDSSKFRKPTGQAVCALGQIAAVITDEKISAADARMIKRAGARLIVAA
jgi:DeoR family transcriptional regulator, ulaG and ulaABCDEF operon transcriptional repressor